MAVRTIEMVRKIRDKHYEETKDLSVEEQIEAVKKKSEKLQEELKTLHRPTSSASEN